MSKRVLVTGGAGFIGHHFVEHCVKNTDWQIVILDSLSYAGDCERFTKIRGYNPKRVKFIYHDLRSPITEEKATKYGFFDYIVHFAAESHVQNSMIDPVIFAESNVVGTTNLLHYAKKYQPNMECFINISTDEVYGGTSANNKHTEWDLIKPTNPYSASKAGQDAMAYAFYKSFDMPIITTRTMNNFGEKQHPEKFIPMVMKQILNNQQINIHASSSGEIGTRYWLHARNHADGVLHILNLKNREDFYGDMFHISGVQKSNLDVAELIAKTMDRELDYVVTSDTGRGGGHDLHYGLDDSKLRNTGWKEPVPFEASIEQTILWTLEHDEWLF